MTTVVVSLLGPTEVDVGAGPIPIVGAKIQALLALLALAAPRPVSDDRLIDELWGDEQPLNPVNALQAQVSQLRRLLGRDTVIRAGSGYLLTVGPDGVDATRLEHLVRNGRSASHNGDHRTAGEHFVAAVALIRGPPLVDVLDHRFAREAASRLDELVISAHEGLVDSELASGHHAEVLGQLTELVRDHPLRERFHAQLILALFRCGRQSDALRAYARARTALAEEVGLEPGPELKALERAVLAHDPSLAAPVTLASISYQAGLPTSLTSFVGRADELGALEDAMARAQLVTIVGPAGAGKTRLALEIAGRIVDREVRLVELASIVDPTTVDETVAAAVGGPDRSPARAGGVPRDPLVRTVERLGNRRVVIILDNCEHVLDAVANVVAQLLAGCPGVRIVTTSREPMGLNGEHQVAMGPLTDDDAATLFAERARAVQPGFDGDRAEVVELCRHLDGLPLAIELAAARSKTLPVPEIAARLQDRFSLLVGSRRSGSDRQRALRAAIDWSYELLLEHERWAFRRLAVFAGGFTSDAADVMCGADALNVVARLVDKSLLVAETSGATARFHMLESLRIYGVDRLADTGEATAAHVAHVQWCVGLAESAEAGIRTFDQVIWLDRLDAEHDNLVAALTWAAENDPETGLRLIGALVLPWWFRSRGRDARRWAETFLAAATGPPAALAKVLTWSGLLADFGGGTSWSGSFEQELELADRRQLHAVAIGEETKDELAVAYGRAQRSLTLTRRALAGVAVDRAEVTELIEAAMTTFQDHGDHFGAGQVRTMQAVGLLSAGDLEGCAFAAESARIHAEQTGDRFVRGRVEWLEGLLADAAGDVELAYRHIERGLQFLDELGMGHEVTAQATLLITLAERRGEHELAGQWRAFVAGRSGGLARHDVLLRASARNGEGLQARQAGDLDRAFAAHQQALEGYRDAGVLGGLAFTESCLGFLAADMGEPLAAAAHHAKALQVASRAGDAAATALSLEGVATGFGDRQAEWAATLLGAASRLWAESGTEPTHRADVATTADRALRMIGAPRFAAAYELGTRQDHASAVDLARSPTEVGARTVDEMR